MNNVGRVQQEEMGSGAGLLGKPQAPGVWKCTVTQGSGHAGRRGGPGPEVDKHRGTGEGEGLRKGGAA